MTPKERAVMQQALGALEPYKAQVVEMGAAYTTAKIDYAVEAAITALREALAEQAEQEPVATMEVFSGWGDEANFEQLPFDLPDGVYKLYAAPVRTKDLTDKFELARIARETGLAVVKCTQSDGWDRIETEADFSKLPDFARAVIAADREKNK